MLRSVLLATGLTIGLAVAANAQTYYYQSYPTYPYPYYGYGYYGYQYPAYASPYYYYPAGRYPAPAAYWDPYVYARPYSDGAGPRVSGHTGY